MSNHASTQILLNQRTVFIEDIINFRLEPLTAFERDIFSFTREWFGQNHLVDFKTSGSTGAPKIIKVKKEQIKASITATAKELNLKPGDNALLCIPVASTGGKMMLARAFELGMALECIEPSNDPLENSENISDFMAMVPLQLHHILQNEFSREKLNRCKKVIVGGAPVEDELTVDIQGLNSRIYATYGMTETVSHIALRLLNTPQRQGYFHVLPGINIEIDERDCLRINGDVTDNKWIQTNDRVKIISSHEFKWLGRTDLVINSGGIKIQPEEVENKLKPIFFQLGVKRSYFIYGQLDPKLGMKCSLMIEGKPLKGNILSEFQRLIDNEISTYEKPRTISFIDKFVYTPGGKLDRKKTLSKLDY